MSKWTPTEMPNLKEKTVVITGANSGIGFYTALEFGRAGARVWLACRNPTKADEALTQLREQVPEGDFKVGKLDLSDLASVRDFSQEVLAEWPRLDFLINNAGIMAIPTRTVTKDGFEMQFGTNHLGHFALTALLTPALLASPAPRVVIVSSTAASFFGNMDFENLDWSRDYGAWKAYGASKLANLLFMKELQKRAKSAGKPLIVTAAHPGYSATNLQTTGPGSDSIFIKISNRLFAQSAEQGAWPTLLAAVATDVAPDGYYGPDGFMEMWGHPAPAKLPELANDEELASKLWTVSEELTQTKFNLV